MPVRTIALVAALAASFAPASATAGELAGLELFDAELTEAQPPAPPAVAGLRPGTVVVLGGEELLRRGYRTLGDALLDIAGISVGRTLRGPRFGLRGIPDGIALVVDGIPAPDGELGTIGFGAETSLAEIERVEITRGPASSIHGVSALSGVVHVITKKPGTSGAVGRASVTQHLERDASIEGTARHDSLAARLSLFHRAGPASAWRLESVPLRYIRVGSAILPANKSNAQVIPEGDDVNLARLVVDAGDVSLDALYTHSLLRAPISSFSHGLLGEGEEEKRIGEQARVAVSGAFTAGELRVEGDLYVDHRNRTDHIPLYPEGGVFLRGGAIDIRTRTLIGGATLRSDFELAGGHRLIGALRATLTDLDAYSDATNPVTAVPEDRLVELEDLTLETSLAVEYQADFGSGWHATAGALLATRGGYSAVLLPRAAVVYVPASWVSLRLAYAEGSRAPDRYELSAFTQAVVDGRITGARPNPSLRPERARSVEVGVSFEPIAELGASVDLFFTEHDGAIAHEVEARELLSTNLGPRGVAGGEVQVFVDAVPGLLRLTGGAALGRTVSGEPLVSNLLQLVGSVEVTPAEGTEIGGRIRASEGDGSDLTSTVDLYLSERPFDWLGIEAGVRNFTDTRTADPDPYALPGTAEVEIPSPDRIFYLSLEARW